MGKSYSLKELAELTGSELVGDPALCVEGVEDLLGAKSSQASFLDNPRYESQLKATEAGAIFIHPSIQRVEGKNYLLSKQPSLAFQKAIELFIPEIRTGFEGIHPTAVIHESAILGERITVGPHAVIDQKATIGDRVFIGAGSYIGAEVEIGSDSVIHPRATLREGCRLGMRVVVQPGAVIGSCGFGYHASAEGKHLALKQRGIVVLEDDVEVGACTTIDRARFKETRIGRGTKIDNLVQIAHQVIVGSDCLIVSQVGIAGSTEIGNHVVIGGQVGIVGHLTIVDRVMLAARSAVSKSITEPGVYSGAPAIPIRQFNEQMVLLRQIKSLAGRLRALEASK